MNTYAEIHRLRNALQKIVNLDQAKDSDFGYSEQGECECFYQAKEIANYDLRNYCN